MMNSMASSKSSTATIGKIGAKISLKALWSEGRAQDTPYSLAHQGIIGSNISNDRGSDVFRFAVSFSAEDDGALGVVQQSLYPIKASVICEASNGPRIGCAICIEVLVAGQRQKSDL